MRGEGFGGKGKEGHSQGGEVFEVCRCEGLTKRQRDVETEG